MSSHSRREVVALVAATALLLSRPGGAGAHPCFLGRWVTPVPPVPPGAPPGTPPPPPQGVPKDCLIEYDFGPGEYNGNWVWRGPFTLSIAGCPVSTGTYQLRMFTGVEGTVELRDYNGLAHAVANVDLGNKLMNFKSVIFRPENWTPPELPPPPPRR